MARRHRGRRALAGGRGRRADQDHERSARGRLRAARRDRRQARRSRARRGHRLYAVRRPQDRAELRAGVADAAKRSANAALSPAALDRVSRAAGRRGAVQHAAEGQAREDGEATVLHARDHHAQRQRSRVVPAPADRPHHERDRVRRAHCAARRDRREDVRAADRHARLLMGLRFLRRLRHVRRRFTSRRRHSRSLRRKGPARAVCCAYARLM